MQEAAAPQEVFNVYRVEMIVVADAETALVDTLTPTEGMRCPTRRFATEGSATAFLGPRNCWITPFTISRVALGFPSGRVREIFVAGSSSRPSTGWYRISKERTLSDPLRSSSTYAANGSTEPPMRKSLPLYLHKRPSAGCDRPCAALSSSATTR